VVHIVLMDSLFSAGQPGDAYFDNIRLTPEPASALWFGGIALWGLLIRRRG